MSGTSLNGQYDAIKKKWGEDIHNFDINSLISNYETNLKTYKENSTKMGELAKNYGGDFSTFDSSTLDEAGKAQYDADYASYMALQDANKAIDTQYLGNINQWNNNTAYGDFMADLGYINTVDSYNKGLAESQEKAAQAEREKTQYAENRRILMEKYLPETLNAMGLANTGLTADAILRMENNYNQYVLGAKSERANAEQDALQGYRDALTQANTDRLNAQYKVWKENQGETSSETGLTAKQQQEISLIDEIRNGASWEHVENYAKAYGWTEGEIQNLKDGVWADREKEDKTALQDETFKTYLSNYANFSEYNMDLWEWIRDAKQNLEDGSLTPEQFNELLEVVNKDYALGLSNTGEQLYYFMGTSGDGKYRFRTSSGDVVELDRGVNPYTNTKNADVDNGVFKNGYQPNNINDVPLEDSGLKLNRYGREQKIWTTTSNGKTEYWYWNGANNAYEPVYASDLAGHVAPLSYDIAGLGSGVSGDHFNLKFGNETTDYKCTPGDEVTDKNIIAKLNKMATGDATKMPSLHESWLGAKDGSNHLYDSNKGATGKIQVIKVGNEYKMYIHVVDNKAGKDSQGAWKELKTRDGNDKAMIEDYMKQYYEANGADSYVAWFKEDVPEAWKTKNNS